MKEKTALGGGVTDPPQDWQTRATRKLLAVRSGKPPSAENEAVRDAMAVLAALTSTAPPHPVDERADASATVQDRSRDGLQGEVTAMVDAVRALRAIALIDRSRVRY